MNYSYKEERTVQNDYTIRFNNKIFQIDKPVYPGLRGGKVTVAVYMDGSVHLSFRNHRLNSHEMDKLMLVSMYPHTAPRGSMAPQSTSPPKPRTPWAPPPDHPWRQYKDRFP